jgi:hypothetical protein
MELLEERYDEAQWQGFQHLEGRRKGTRTAVSV